MPTQEQKTPKQIANLREYLRLKEIHKATGLIGGRIFYAGQFWEKEDFNTLFPIPKLEYNTTHLDSTQIAR